MIGSRSPKSTGESGNAPSPYAALVPLMLYWMYWASLSRGLGLTVKDCTPASSQMH